MPIKSNLYVLDDDPQYADLLAEAAAKVGWRSISEQSAAAFFSYDLPKNVILVLDLNMPEMDGIEVIRTIAQREIDLQLILISGFDARVLHSAQQLAEAHNIKVLACLSKPIAIQEFIKTLDRIKLNPSFHGKTADEHNSISAEELVRAIKQHQLILYYQPQINIKTGVFKGVEALVRWKHPELGMIFPEQFISLAERNDLIDQLTEEVITIAVEQSKHWESESFITTISVNVSATNITSLCLPEQLKKLTDKYAIDPKRITLEITESAVMRELTSSLDVLNRLRMKGFSLSIDDFGTGYSSLSHLYQAPFVELKIDRHFIMRMLDDTEAMVIVKICIMLAHMLGMKVVAEGVETQEIWDKLELLGCDAAQGYFIAKPMPANDLIKWKRNRH